MVQPVPNAFGVAKPVPVDLSALATACPADERKRWDTLTELLQDARQREASEIHVEPEQDCLRVRFRSSFEFTEIRLEDDSEYRHSLELLQQRLGLQSASVPSARAWFTYGLADNAELYQLDVIDSRKGATLRILCLGDSLQLPRRLEDIGLNRNQLGRLDAALNKRNGLIVVASRLGSARRQTCRAITQRMVAPDRKIIMADMPMHPDIPRTTQMAMDFPPDPAQRDNWNALCQLGADVIVSTQNLQDNDARALASLASSESVVVNSISASGASECLARLLGQGIRSETLAQCLSAMVLQYRVRCLCNYCRIPATPDDNGTAWLARYSPIQAGNINDWLRHRMRSTFSEAGSCDRCRHSGHQRWLDIFDIVRISDEIREALYDGDYPCAFSLLEENQYLGENLLRLAQEGIISLQEAIRLTEERDAGRETLAA